MQRMPSYSMCSMLAAAVKQALKSTSSSSCLLSLNTNQLWSHASRRHLSMASKLGNRMAAAIDCSTKLDHKIPLLVPSLEELNGVLDKAFKNNYANVNIDIVDCPNLREAPFRMTASGIGNNLRIAEVGGIPNLYPHGTKKFFNLKKVCETCEMREAFVFGPGAGPFDAIGHSSELVANANFIDGQYKVANKVVWVVPSAKGYAMSTIDSTDFEITANLAISDGCAGRKVLRIRAAKRKGGLNYPETIQKALENHYGDQLVSLAGLFILQKGKVYMHVLPDYPESPRKVDEKKDDWLQYMRYYDMDAPMIFASVVHSNDTGGYKLRVEHTHGYSEHGDSGHYHIDTTPELVEYEGYFAPANMVYRIDKI